MYRCNKPIFSVLRETFVADLKLSKKGCSRYHYIIQLLCQYKFTLSVHSKYNLGI